MEERTGKALVLLGVAAAAFLLVFLFAFNIVLIFKIGPKKAETERLEQKYNAILVKQEETKDAIEYINDIRFIEEYAREVLGYGKDGEVRYEPR